MKTKRTLSESHLLLLSIVCFALAAIHYFGVVMQDDATGRMIVGAVWFLMGVAWGLQFHSARRRERAEPSSSERRAER